MNIVPFVNDGIELYIDTQTGESFASLSGYARMSGIAINTISMRVSRLNEVHKESIKTAEIQMGNGLRTVHLLPEILITQWITKDNPDLAAKMMQAGVRVFLHSLAGYKVKSDAIQAPDLSQMDVLVATVHMLQAQEKQLKEQQRQLDEHDIRLTYTEQHMKMLGAVRGYTTIAGFGVQIGVRIPITDARAIAVIAKRLCKEQELEPSYVPDERWGKVNSYPIEVLEQAYEQFRISNELRNSTEVL